MLNIPVHSEVTDPRSVVVNIASCPYCGTHEEPEDRDGVLSCPNCGYPFTQEALLVEEWEMLIAEQADQLDEAGWAHLLVQAEDALQGIDTLVEEGETVC